MRFLFLTAQLQPFLCSGLNELVATTNAQVLVYTQKRKENDDLVFDHSHIRIVTYVDEPQADFRLEAEKFQPDVVFCAGWMFRVYMSWCRRWKAIGMKTICAMDTQWNASLRQRMLVTLAPLVLRTAFTHAWVPGRRQKEYALRLGFSEDAILDGLYAANIGLFSGVWKYSANADHTRAFPRRLLYVGRLEPHKIRNFLIAVNRLFAEGHCSWKLDLIGNGSMASDPLLQHPSISLREHLGQTELANEAARGGVFCLCSYDEPWGTVVQEFAAAGMPLLISRQCGSSDQYLKDNGWLCDGANVEDILRMLRVVLATPDRSLFHMAQRSVVLGAAPDSGDWVRTLVSVC